MTYRLLLIPKSVPFPTVRTLPGNMIAGHTPDILVHACLANGKATPTGPIEWGYGMAASTGNILSATSPGSFRRTTFYRIWCDQIISSLYKSGQHSNPYQLACLFPHTCYMNRRFKGSELEGARDALSIKRKALSRL